MTHEDMLTRLDAISTERYPLITDLDMDALKMAVSLLDQEPTTKNDLADEYISRKALMVILSDYYDTTEEYRSMLKEIAALPSITPQPRKGHWIDEGIYADGHNQHAFMCSKCEGHYIGYAGDFKWCPYCGSDNREVEE